ncbi:MAG: phosphotransferase family protein [Candidatus Hodarchaeota archaeon]
MKNETNMEEEFLAYYKSSYPDVTNVDLIVEEFCNITDGWETEVFSIKLKSKSNTLPTTKRLILRIYPGQDAYAKSAREFHAMKKLHELEYPVPRVFLLERENSPFNQPFVIMEYINGIIMGEKFNSHEVQKKFVELFTKLHSLDYKAFVTNASSYKKDLVRLKLKNFHNVISHYNRKEYLPVIDWFDHKSQSIITDRFSPIHYDFHPYNILIRKEDKKPIVIDWGGFEISDYRIDLAWTLLLVSTYERPHMRNVILKEYERISGEGVDNIEFFEGLMALRRLFLIQASLINGAEQHGMRSGAGEEMRKNINHIKNVYSLFQDRTEMNIPEIEDLIGQVENK